MTAFVAIDVGTANHWTASVCQVGLAVFEAGEVVERFYTLVDPGPNQPFHPINVRLNGIDREQVRGAPAFGDVLPRLRAYTSERVAVTFSPFSRCALNGATDAASQERLATRWVDVVRLVHRYVPGLKCGYGLAAVTTQLGLPGFTSHQALEEAVAAGLVLLEVCRRARRSLDDVLGEVGRGAASLELTTSGPLAGETVVFTGALVMVREDAARIAQEAGATVGKGVTRSTTVLVVGDQDLRLVGDDGKSSKHEKAEKLIGEGQRLRIIGESDFFALVR